MRAEFTDDLITGNELIDSQHEELIGRINKLLDSCEAGEGKISAIKMLDYLAKYTDTHFGDEEALQKEVCYPDYDKHHAKHEEFKQTIQELNKMLQEEEGPSDAFVRKVEEHVVKWFYRHISSFDRSVAEYINMARKRRKIIIRIHTWILNICNLKSYSLKKEYDFFVQLRQF